VVQAAAAYRIEDAPDQAAAYVGVEGGGLHVEKADGLFTGDVVRGAGG